MTTDPAAMPWAAVARVNIPGIARCTAVMVDTHWAVTAAHCLWSARLGHLVPLSAIHILPGYADGGFARHLQPDEVRFVPGVDPSAPGPQGGDLALLHLPIGAPAILPPHAPAIVPGERLAAGGYGQDRAERLLIDPLCHAVGYAQGRDGRPLLVHDCQATHGASGGPVLAKGMDGEWRLVGIEIAARRDAAGGVAVPGATLAALLDAAKRDGPVKQDE